MVELPVVRLDLERTVRDCGSDTRDAEARVPVRVDAPVRLDAPVVPETAVAVRTVEPPLVVGIASALSIH